MDDEHEIRTDGSRVDSDVETRSATDVMQAVGVFAGGVGTFVSGVAYGASKLAEHVGGGDESQGQPPSGDQSGAKPE